MKQLIFPLFFLTLSLSTNAQKDSANFYLGFKTAYGLILQKDISTKSHAIDAVFNQNNFVLGTQCIFGYFISDKSQIELSYLNNKYFRNDGRLRQSIRDRFSDEFVYISTSEDNRINTFGRNTENVLTINYQYNFKGSRFLVSPIIGVGLGAFSTPILRYVRREKDSNYFTEFKIKNKAKGFWQYNFGFNLAIKKWPFIRFSAAYQIAKIENRFKVDTKDNFEIEERKTSNFSTSSNLLSFGILVTLPLAPEPK